MIITMIKIILLIIVRHAPLLNRPMYVYIYISIYIYIYIMYIYIYIHILYNILISILCTCVYVYVCICVYIYIYIYAMLRQVGGGLGDVLPQSDSDPPRLESPSSEELRQGSVGSALKHLKVLSCYVDCLEAASARPRDPSSSHGWCQVICASVMYTVYRIPYTVYRIP